MDGDLFIPPADDATVARLLAAGYEYGRFFGLMQYKSPGGRFTTDAAEALRWLEATEGQGRDTDA